MSRRLVAAVAALVLALVGTFVIVAYVSGADERAMSDMAPVEVLVVTTPVPEGTPVDQLTDLVAPKEVPASAVSPGALTSLDEVSGRVVQTGLQPGEQLLAHRFVEPEVLAVASDVKVPAGKHQVTVQLERTRVLGGQLLAGQEVGVFVSTNGAVKEKNTTHLTVDGVLVTRVEGGVGAPAEGAAEPSTPPADQPADQAPPAESVTVTLALDAADAEKVVFAAEYEQIWLSLQGAKAGSKGTSVVTRENLYK
ncbi:RcpC/CpaB family pilus assembly protein [Janibacter terrae]|uniref:RcpC/CpaB family pilus assembly protein n=1 Tax=Janibacter terrae TaxID=103817 RepID=A0ABZ2F9U6_9MICO|nr:RcpC/CpaB family pilus assembly protein [Janibacter terrae]